ncbi:hypothetical protein WDV76_03060 [Xenorhabdus griffiniae]|uniref:hypothetical protein n=1 Tax=Xenorhabdus griffiniae TaxID=351672 RepID=UPI0030D4FD0B
MAEFTLTIKLTPDENSKVNIKTEGALQGSPSLYFAVFAKSLADQIRSSLQGKAEIAPEIAQLNQRILNCDCDDDE